MIYKQIGTLALGSRLRMLTESVTEDAKKVYDLYDVELKPKWFPVFYVLSQSEEQSITSIAEEIGHSHPSVSKIVREMCKAGITKEKRDKNDGRRNLITLTQKGLDIVDKIQDQYTDVIQAVESALNQTQHNIWKAMEEFELLLGQKSLFQRVKEAKSKRALEKVKLVPYEDKYHKHFKEMNESWIRTHFKIEEIDKKALDHPKATILDRGGHILVALYNDEPVGVCALLKNDHIESDYELAKMAVSPEVQRLGIGQLLVKGLINLAKSEGAKEIYLESNTKLEPAIRLYHKLGFEKVSGIHTPYERCDIQMVLKI